MATAERFEKEVERTVVEKQQMVRLELTADMATTLAELVDSVLARGFTASTTYRTHADEISRALAGAGIYSNDDRLEGSVVAQPLPKEPA